MAFPTQGSCRRETFVMVSYNWWSCCLLNKVLQLQKIYNVEQLVSLATSVRHSPTPSAKLHIHE